MRNTFSIKSVFSLKINIYGKIRFSAGPTYLQHSASESSGGTVLYKGEWRIAGNGETLVLSQRKQVYPATDAKRFPDDSREFPIFKLNGKTLIIGWYTDYKDDDGNDRTTFQPFTYKRLKRGITDVSAR